MTDTAKFTKWAKNFAKQPGYGQLVQEWMEDLDMNRIVPMVEDLKEVGFVYNMSVGSLKKNISNILLTPGQFSSTKTLQW